VAVSKPGLKYVVASGNRMNSTSRLAQGVVNEIVRYIPRTDRGLSKGEVLTASRNDVRPGVITFVGLTLKKIADPAGGTRGIKRKAYKLFPAAEE
jgi:hypothetical protein